MKAANYLKWIGVAAAAGTALGMISNLKKPEQGGLIGAAVGVIAGSVAAELYKRMKTDEDGVNYYTKSSPLYESFKDIGYV
jgi:hypothetical protein